MTRRIGIELNGYSVTVEHFPDLKRPCLVVKPKGNMCAYKVATFNSEKTADWFLTQMSRMFEQTEREDE